MEEANVEDFAVKLTMSDPKPAMKTFRGETERYLKQLEGISGSSINLSDLIDNVNRITWISAIAGSGKSVLVKQLTYKWAKFELFREFKVCITFECRELNYFALNEGKKFEKHELIIEFIKGTIGFDVMDSKDVLFIVDGLDELYDINEKDSIIGQLLDIKKCKYPKSKIIITGRPHIENRLMRHGGRNMGGLRKVEIIGLSNEQIDEYIRKFASSDKEVAKMLKATDVSKNNIKILSVPQMLSSFCCVTLLSEDIGIKNAAELYCWSFYLLLKQHAEKDGPRDKRIPEIFNEYSKDLLVLSKICHGLLNENRIIFEGNIELQFGDIGKGTEFLKGLFVDVSDNFHARKQFKHLTLMEFLSAVYVCTIESPTEIIKDILKRRLDQVLLFNCQMISGLMDNGIIKEMFENVADLRQINCYNFFCNIVRLVRECIKDDDESFHLSIDVIMCLMNKDVVNKQFILSIVNQLSFKNVGFVSSRKWIEMTNLLNKGFQCHEIELKKAFENVHFGRCEVSDLNELKYAKLLASIYWIRLDGRMAMTTTVRDIRKEIGETNENGKCKMVSICYCKLQDEQFEDELTDSSKLEWLHIEGCNVNEKSFFNLCKWIISSSVKKFELSDIKDMKVEWWNMLIDAIANAKVKNERDLALRKLEIKYCPLMNDELKKKVITFIMIYNDSSFICKCYTLKCQINSPCHSLLF